MENASDAIIMAGAVLIFVIALSVAMTLFSQARVTVDTVVYASDRTNYYEYMDIDVSNNVKNRIVSLETIIPTLYKYYKENYTVVFLKQNGDGMKLYDSDPTRKANWSQDSSGNPKDFVVEKYPGMSGTQVCSFDINEELIRREPWVGSPIDTRENLEAFLNGGTYGTYHYPGFIQQYSGDYFRETIGEYRTNNKDTFASGLNQGIRDNKNKRVIVYQLMN
ncbi:MAG: hypothetical protein HFJ29_05655 [Clostridia bacterium]|nr:hypothetical protein [Clostridia bacterium]